ncbi:MAG: glycoside hydrolase family 28 protein [Spirochaetota bacterium]
MTTTISVLDHKADPSGATKATASIQAALDAAGAAGGGTVVVPPGRYLIGTIRLRSNVRLHLELGSTLVGSPDIDDYEDENEGHVPPEFPYVRCLVVGFDLENVEISGGGTIDGAGAAFMDYSVPTFDETFTKEALAAMPADRRDEYVSEHGGKRPTWIFFLRRCRNVRFRDFRIVDVARWTARFSRCENILMNGLFIENDLRAANSDGMHFTSCRNIVVSDCTIQSGDDCIAITNYGDNDADTSGAVVTNCVFTSHSAGIRIGFAKQGLLEDVTVSNCVFRRCNRGIGIFCGPDAIVRHVNISNLQMSTRLIAGTWWGKAEPFMITTLGKGALIEDINVSNVSARGEQGIVVNATPGSTVRNVTFSDVRLRIVAGPMTPFSGGTYDLRPLSMERRALPAIIADGVDSLTLRNVDVSIDEAAREHFPNAVEFVNCRGLAIEGLRERATPGRGGAAPTRVGASVGGPGAGRPSTGGTA